MIHILLHTLALLPLMLCALALPARAMNVELEQLARWQLNNADLLVEEGRYMEAVEYIDSAYEASEYPKTRADALLAKAMVMATFLDEPGKALDIYRRLGREHPEHAETASFQAAFLLMGMDRTTEARAAFKEYLARYPEGRFVFQAEALLESLGVPGPKPEARPEPAPEPRPAPLSKDRPVLRVALARKAASVTLSGSDGAQLCAEGFECAQRLEISTSSGGLRVNGSALPSASVTISSKAPISVKLGSSSKRVRGVMQVANRDGRLLVLNLVDIESYLLSVVPAESYASWPQEALKAQAVAARTYAYYQKLHRAGRAYDMLDDTRDQMYSGVDKERDSTTQAVQATAGLILTHGGKPILSQYTANSGGHSADAGAVFDTPKSYLVSHRDPASLKGKMASWTRTHTTSEIVAKLKSIGVDVSGLRAIEPAQTGPSGRIIKVRLVHAGGGTVLRTRTTIGSSRVLKLPDVLVDIQRSGETWTFAGHGFGHGVGYSQWGGAILGKTNDYRKILQFYYTGASIEQRWN